MKYVLGTYNTVFFTIKITKKNWKKSDKTNLILTPWIGQHGKETKGIIAFQIQYTVTGKTIDLSKHVYHTFIHSSIQQI